MKKHFLIVLTSLFLGFSAEAALVPTPEEKTFSPEAAAIINECKNENIAEFNNCLKKELADIINQVFDNPENVYLLKQMDEIEKNVEEAEFNLEDEQVKKIVANKEAAHELRLLNLNLIWQKMLNNTLNMILASQVEI